MCIIETILKADLILTKFTICNLREAWVSCSKVSSALQQDFEPMALGPKNPHGNGFKAVETDLLTEKKAMRIADPFKGRIWKIKNPQSLHPITGWQALLCRKLVRIVS